MPKSRLKEDGELSTELWVVSVVNTGSILAGHSAIIIEGLKPKEDRMVGGNELFYGFYDIRATMNPGDEKISSVLQTGYVHKIEVKELNHYPELKDISRYYARSWEIKPERAHKIIAAIKKDRNDLLAIDDGYAPGSHPDKSRYPKWSVLGMESIVGDLLGRGMNCTNYCANWLKAGDIGTHGKKPSSPMCRVM